MPAFRDDFCPFVQEVFLIGTYCDVLFCDAEIASSFTTSACWGISSNTPGDVIQNSCVFKVPYMFRKFCIVFTMLVAKCFCMVVIVKLEIITTTVICMRTGDCWYNCLINNVFSKIFTVEWAASWISGHVRHATTAHFNDIRVENFV